MDDKNEKRSAVYSKKYKKGVSFNNLVNVMDALNQKKIIVNLIETSTYSDGTESMTIKIDRIDVSNW